MALAVPYPLEPMEAKQVDRLPDGDGWAFEPKWDGFRCLAFRDGDDVRLQSKAGKPLGRYFPEIVTALAALGARRFVLDGELVVPADDSLSFDALLQRVHPAESRIARLAAETPALYVLFDLLLAERGGPLLERPLHVRRARLEAFAARYATSPDERTGDRLRVSPQILTGTEAQAWLDAAHGGLDGVMAKRLDAAYDAGGRDAMLKVKRRRTIDCVVGGFRYQSRGRLVGSLLLGLYDDDRLLHHVGFTSGIRNAERPALTKRLESLVAPPGFTGSAPGGPSRWSTERSAEWKPLAPELVVEVEYDHFSQGRFRHGARLVRWRPDKAAKQCTFRQLADAGTSSLGLF